MSRKGRRKQAQAKRRQTPSQREHVDFGPTPEAALKKVEALGLTAACNVRTKQVVALDNTGREVNYLMADASTALAMMYERGLLQCDGYDASDLRALGESYRRFFWREYGRPIPSGVGHQVAAGSPALTNPDVLLDDDLREGHDEWMAKAAQRELMMRTHLRLRLSWGEYNAFTNVVCCDQWPSRSEHEVVIKGLCALVDWRRGGKGK